MSTTIKLSLETKQRIDKLKIHKRESYEEVLQSILDILNTCKINPMHARGRLFELEKLRSKINKINVKQINKSPAKNQVS